MSPAGLRSKRFASVTAGRSPRFGVLYGIKDGGLVQSAIQNPIDAFHYAGEDDVLALAVRLGIAIARNHGFADGAKRTGAVAMLGFLAVNGHSLDMPDDTLLGRMIEAVLTCDMTEEELMDHIAGYISVDQ